MATTDKQKLDVKGFESNEGIFKQGSPANIDRIGGLYTETIREILQHTADICHCLCYEEYIIPEELCRQVTKYLRQVYKLLVFRPHKLAKLREVQHQKTLEHDCSLARKLSENDEAELFTYFITLEKDMKQLSDWLVVPMLDVEDPDFVEALVEQEGKFPPPSNYLLHSDIHDPTIGLE